jgi:hypothetical protein
MKSPFPGMDPYLEQHWGDVHHNLITFAQGMLNEHLPRDLRARVQERVLVELPAEDREPVEVAFPEPETQGYIEIVDPTPSPRSCRLCEQRPFQSEH